MIPENLQDKFYELLGVPPWDEKILKQCYFIDVNLKLSK